MQQDSCFPHEIGLLLGYPIEDVEGFIANKGKNYLYAGYWKVYENVEEKKLLFEAYESAKDGVLLLVANGYEIKSIIRGIQSSKNSKDWMQAIKKQKQCTDIYFGMDVIGKVYLLDKDVIYFWRRK